MSISSAEYTLNDEAWKDSFDKLRPPTSVLRKLNVVKRVNDIHASFNLNSSIENSVDNVEKKYTVALRNKRLEQLFAPPIIVNSLTSEITEKSAIADDGPEDDSKLFISTPMSDRISSNQFKCSISPVVLWKFRKFGKIKTSKRTGKRTSLIRQATKKLSLQKTTKATNGINSERKLVHSSAHAVKRVGFTQENVPSEKSSIEIIVPSSAPNKIENGHQIRSSNIALQAGKWRKSLSVWRRTCNGKDNPNSSLRIINDSYDVLVPHVAVARKSVVLIRDFSAARKTKSVGVESVFKNDQDWCQRVLERCKQRNPKQFSRAFSTAQLDNCKKIGEGVYGEVFKYKTSKAPCNDDRVVKIIPIEGELDVNGEKQKTFKEILPEIIITTELSQLQFTANRDFVTFSFISIKKVSCVKGKYPQRLIQLWDEYDEAKSSENERPDIFPNTQLYIMLELANGGQDMEAFAFTSAEQSYAVLQQVVLALAVAEEAFQFEHRDLHWGNMLLHSTKDAELMYKLNRQEVTIQTHGVHLTIIDYTLSRATFDNCCLYNDLSQDEDLFDATGDYQFDIYRMMRDVLDNKWERYEPKTNVFWISYVVQKLLTGVTYRNTSLKKHNLNIAKLQNLQKHIFNFDSAVDVAEYLFARDFK